MASEAITKLLLETAQYDSKLVKAKKGMKDFGDQGLSTGSVLKALGGTLGKLAGALGVAASATKVATDAFLKNEAQLDEWGRSVESAKAVYNAFLDGLNNGDISGFLSNIDDIVNAARDAYDALDDLNTDNAFNQRENAKNEAGYQEALEQYKLHPTKANKAALTAANNAVVKDLQRQQTDSEKAYQAALNSMVKGKGLNQRQQNLIKNLFANQSSDQLKQLKNGYSQGRGLNFAAKYWKGNQVDGDELLIRTAGGTVKARRKMTAAEKDQYTIARALSQVNDTEIESVQKLGTAYYELGSQIAQQNRSYNRLAGNNGKTTSSNHTSHTSTRTEEVYGAGELGAYQKQIQELEKAQKHASDSASYSELQGQIDALNEKIKQITSTNSNASNSTNALAEKMTNLKKQVDALNPSSLEYLNTLREIARLELQMKTNAGAAKTTKENATSSPGISISGQETQAAIDATDEMSKEPITLEGPDLAKKGKDTAAAWNAAYQSISNVATALQYTNDTGLNVAGIIMQAIANIVAGFAQASSSPATSAAGIWGWIAAGTAGIAQMMAMISQIQSVTGFANGGVVPGHSYSGDKLYARLNSGETVLNQQQAALANSLIDNGGGNGMRSTISGEQIITVMRATAKRKGKPVGELLK